MKLPDLISRYFNPKKYSTNTIIIVVGYLNTVMTAYGDKGFSHATNISNDDPEYIGRYRSFMKQYSGWSVVLLIDNEQIKTSIEKIPSFSGVLNSNNLLKGSLVSSAPQGSILAYKDLSSMQVNDSDELDSDSKLVQLFSFAPNAQIIDIITFIFNFGFPLIGIYFLRLEIKEMVRNLGKKMSLNMEDNLYVIAIPTYASGLIVMILEDHKVVSYGVSEYNLHKSDEYLKGVIEQEISDILIKNKKYISSSKKQLNILTITSKKIAELLSGVSWKHEYIPLTWMDDNYKLGITHGFGDEFIINNLQLLHSSYNRTLRKIKKLDKIRSRLMRGAVAIIASITIYGLFVTSQIMRLNSNLDVLEDEYYKISEQYKVARQTIKHITNMQLVYDIMSDITVLEADVQQPIKIIKYLVDSREEKLHLARVLWEMRSGDDKKNLSDLFVYAKYGNEFLSEKGVERKSLEYQKSISRLLPNYEIKILDNMSKDEIESNSIIPVKLTIQGR